MERIYLDNAATSFPKPPRVAEAVYRYMTQSGVNINRGCYGKAYQAEELVFETRELLCGLFHGPDCRNVVFTKNVTESLNVIMKGLLRPGDHFIVSSMEHNAVMRPAVQLERAGCEFSRVPCNEDGTLCFDKLEACVQENTKAVIMTHASNVCGTLMPVREVGEFCAGHGLKFVLDSAQTAGIWDIDMEEMHIDALAFTGHKGLLGPQGTGGFVLAGGMAEELSPLLSGGTGSLSHREEMPDFMPDRFEAGTLNLPGIAGLREGLLWLRDTGLERVREHELELTGMFLDGLVSLENAGLLRILGKKGTEGRTGVVSVQTLKKELSQAALELDEEFGIMARVGLHCAPSAHKALGSFPVGSIRFSFGWWNTVEHVDEALNALEEVCRGA